MNKPSDPTPLRNLSLHDSFFRFHHFLNWRDGLALAGVVLVTLFVCDATIWRPGYLFGIDENVQVAEAQSWWAGRMDLPERKWDTALHDGRVFSHFPPMFSFLSAMVVPFFSGVPHWFVLLVVVLPVPVLAYLLIRVALFTAPLPSGKGDALPDAKGRAVIWCAVMAIGLVCGTSALPVLEKALRSGGPYYVNQALALSALLLFLLEYFGRGRFWVAGLALIAAAWSRQMSVAYVVPLAWMVWERGRLKTPLGPPLVRGEAALTPTLSQGERELAVTPAFSQGEREVGLRELKFATRTRTGSRELFRRAEIGVRLSLVFGVAMGVPMGLNWLKFGNPLESGYMLIYEGRMDDPFAKDAREHGLFSSEYIPRNLYYTNAGFPTLQRIERGQRPEWYLAQQQWGTGIWWTTPLLLFFVFELKSWLGEARLRVLVVGAAIVYIGLMLYHSTGYKQRGYNRYSLDFVPVLFVLASMAATRTQWRRAAAVCLIGWSVFYFVIMRHWPQVRVW